MFQLSTFYTVALSYDGEVIEIKNEPPTIHSDEDLENLAIKLYEETKDKCLVSAFVLVFWSS